MYIYVLQIMCLYIFKTCVEISQTPNQERGPLALSIFLRRSLGTFFFTSQPLTPLEVFGSPTCCPLKWQEPTSVSMDIPWMTVFQHGSTKSHLLKLMLSINPFPSMKSHCDSMDEDRHVLECKQSPFFGGRGRGGPLFFTFMNVFFFRKSSRLNHPVYRSKTHASQLVVPRHIHTKQDMSHLSKV